MAGAAVPALVAGVLVAAAQTAPQQVVTRAPAWEPVALGTTLAAAVNTFDNSPRGARISRARSYDSGEPFSEVHPGRPGAMTFARATSFARGKSLRIDSTGVRERSYVGWAGGRLGSRGELHASVYLRLRALPAKRISVLEFRDGRALAARVTIGSTGRVRVVDAAGNATSGGRAVKAKRWFRLEADVRAGNGSGVVRARVYTGPDAGTSDARAVLRGARTGARVSVARFGSTTKLRSHPRLFVDAVQVRSDRRPGRYVPPASPSTIRQGFESGTGAFNKVVNASTTAARVLTGRRSLQLDARSSRSYAEMSQALFGTDKRYARLKFRYRYDGPAKPAVNQPVVNVRNTSSIDYNGGGHLNMWLDRRTGTIKGDLQSQDDFNTHVRYAPGRTYRITVKVSFRKDGTSRAVIRVNGARRASVTSTTRNHDRLRSVLLGSTTRHEGYRATYDAFRLTTSRRPL